MPHLVATLIYLSQNYSYYIRGDRSPLMYELVFLMLTYFCGLRMISQYSHHFHIYMGVILSHNFLFEKIALTMFRPTAFLQNEDKLPPTLLWAAV